MSLPSASALPISSSADGSSYPYLRNSCDSDSIVRVPSEEVDCRIILRIASGPPLDIVALDWDLACCESILDSTSWAIASGRLDFATACDSSSGDSKNFDSEP